MKASEKNRLQNSMTVSNIGIASVLTDPFCKTATQIISYLLEHTAESFNEKACRKLIQKGAQAKSDDIIASISGYKIESDQALKFRLAQQHLDYIEEIITKTEVELYVRIKPYWQLVELISTIPGVTNLSATIILGEIGTDMSIFEDAKHLTSWAGLTPGNNESAGKKKSVRIGKAGQYIKPLFVQCAFSAIRSKKEPYLGVKYRRIKSRRGHKSVKVNQTTSYGRITTASTRRAGRAL